MTGTDEAGPRADEPDGAPRLASLDVIRGIAILGILFMNINEMGGSMWASFDDIRHFGWTSADQAVWWVREVIADGTARGLLQLLFGAGMLILTDRAAGAMDDAVVVRRYLWRNLVLLGFGLAHLFLLLWPGDILHTYALAAMLVVFARALPARQMLALGLSAALFTLIVGGLGYGSAAQRRGPASAAVTDPTPDERARIVHEDAARTDDFESWAGSAWEAIEAMSGAGLEMDFVWESAAAMLVGAALYRWGIIQGERTRRFYVAMAAAGYAVGLPLRIWSAVQTTRFDGAPNIDMATYEVARLATTIGHLGAIHLLLATAIGARLLRPFAAAGRTALSLYILQTLVCLWLLYPPFGLGLYGRQGWTAMMTSALAIDAMLLLLATWWVRRFRMAPVEWAWRSVAERRLLPFRA